MTAAVLDRVALDEPRCQFGLCRRPAERRVVAVDGDSEVVLEVCQLHERPAAAWGRPAPLKLLTVRSI